MPRHSSASGYHKAFVEWRERYLRAVLEEYGGCVAKAARAIGVSKHLFYKQRLRAARVRGNAEWRALQ